MNINPDMGFADRIQEIKREVLYGTSFIMH